MAAGVPGDITTLPGTQKPINYRPYVSGGARVLVYYAAVAAGVHCARPVGHKTLGPGREDGDAE